MFRLLGQRLIKKRLTNLQRLLTSEDLPINVISMTHSSNWQAAKRFSGKSRDDIVTLSGDRQEGWVDVGRSAVNR